MELIKHWKVSFFRWNFNEKYSKASKDYNRKPTDEELIIFSEDCDKNDIEFIGFPTTIEVKEYYRIKS